MGRARQNRLWWLAATALLMGGCSAGADDTTDVPVRDDGGTADDAGDVPPDVPEVVTCTPGAVLCIGGDAHVCNATGDDWETVTDCVDPTPVCVPDRGCAVCRPRDAECVDDMAARTCTDDGTGWTTDACDAGLGERCESGVCTDLTPACEEARRNNSYEGCDYWATQTINSGLRDDYIDSFRYAFVIGNRQDGPAQVQVQDATGVVAEVAVLPNTTQVLELDWNHALREPRASASAPLHSATVVGGGFRVRSDVPVTVYQFNPLRYWAAVLIGSHSNDASLLLPRHVLTGNYMAVSRPTLMRYERVIDSGAEAYYGQPGFLAVVGTENGTEVTIDFTAHTEAGVAGSGIAAYRPGDSGTFHIDRFDVLQIVTAVPASCAVVREEVHPSNPYLMAGYCDVGDTYDLTGSLVVADKPVALFSGHDCSFVPFDRWACDHLEEQIFPLEAWGTRYLATRGDPITDEGNVWRVISREDDNDVTFLPDAWIPVHLDRGEWLEFESELDFEIAGTKPLLAVQFLVGEGSDLDSIGDPAMSLAVPVEQYRAAYNFLAPADYHTDLSIALRGENWVNVMAPTGAEVLLDGAAVTGFATIGTTGFDVARVPLDGGSHAISSTAEFGITCYGYGNYTSYMYPGGLDVDPIHPFL